MRRCVCAVLVVALALVGLTTLQSSEAEGHEARRLTCFVADIEYLGRNGDDHVWAVTTTFVNDRNRDLLMQAIYERTTNGALFRAIYREVRAHHSANKTRRFLTKFDEFDWELTHCHRVMR
jgi:hypothetical protein